MSTDTVTVADQEQEHIESQTQMETTLDTQVEQQETQDTQEQVQESNVQQVPLTALQKERRKRQEIEEELRAYKEREQSSTANQYEEESYETATKGDLRQNQEEILRQVEERSWMRTNPDKVAYVDGNLTQFLKQRPHLALAIKAAPNRYEEAWMLMDRLNPKQKMDLRQPQQPKKAAPGAPGSIPKAAGMNQSIDVMSMNDEEFAAWRASKRRRG